MNRKRAKAIHSGSSLRPELDQLEQLGGGGDLPVATAIRLFPDRSSFEKVLRLYHSHGLVRIVRTDENGEIDVPLWQVDTLIRDGMLLESSGLRVKCTTEGWRQFAQDSQGFFRRLFVKE